MLKEGSKIKAKHIKTGKLISYLVVTERLKEEYFRLLNLDSCKIMSGFMTTDAKKIIEYIEKVLKCEIVEVTLKEK